MGHLVRHLANKHEVEVVWYSCDQEHCNFKTKEASNLRCHRKRVHHITWEKMRGERKAKTTPEAVVKSSAVVAVVGLKAQKPRAPASVATI